MLQRMYTRLGCEGRPPRFQVEFYPYSSLILTIRRRRDAIIVRFSDLLRRAPREVLEAGATLLLARLYRRRADDSLTSAYVEYARSHKTRQRIHQMRRSRIRPGGDGPRGKHFDLASLFQKLNARYFAGRLAQPHISWSRQRWRRQFGSYDPGPNQILLNCHLDRAGVPQLVVEYVLFQEMLHVKHPTRKSGCSLVSHSPEFRREEKRFEEFDRARRMLDRLAR